MTHSPRHYWIAVMLGIMGLIVSYSAVILLNGGPSAFAASSSCPFAAHNEKPCNCADHADCANGDCKGTCAGCAGS